MVDHEGSVIIRIAHTEATTGIPSEQTVDPESGKIDSDGHLGILSTGEILIFHADELGFASEMD
ncbi:MAG: hypothetical protein Q9191_004912 [Dirinaria sp. TL-2023a]